MEKGIFQGFVLEPACLISISPSTTVHILGFLQVTWVWRNILALLEEDKLPIGPDHVSLVYLSLHPNLSKNTYNFNIDRPKHLQK